MASEECSSSSTADSSEKMEVLKKANELLAQGKRNVVCGEVPKAISLFDEAVQMLAKEYGDLSRNCADAYFSYGSALLELGRMETNVLGVALEGVDVDAKEDEGESDQFEKPPAEDDKEGEEEEEEEDGEEETAEEEGQEEEGGQEGEGAESQDDGEEKDEDVPNFQLAWEYLDLAKVIYLKSEAKDEQLKAAECHIKLGEVSMETEQHATAAEDLQSALKIQQKFLSPEDRVIAETHYQLGLAYGLGKEFELSIQHYHQAISVIEAKIASLNKMVEDNEVAAGNKENRETDELQKYKDEIKELQELIPEMKNKIEDTKSEAKDMEKMREMAKEMLGLTGTSKGFGSPTKKASGSPTKKTDTPAAGGDVDENGEKKASDISNLVRKKRKPEEEAPAASIVEVKKIKQDDAAASVATEAGDGSADAKVKEAAEVKVNGTAEVMSNGDANEVEMADTAAAAAGTASS